MLGGLSGDGGLTWSKLPTAPSLLGERPVWDDRYRVLVWVDIISGELHRYRPGGNEDLLFKAWASIGTVALGDWGGYVLACQSGFVFIDARGVVVDTAPRPPGFDDDVRFNDGACDPRGRFFVGTVAVDGSPEKGRLYRLDHDGVATVMLEGISESNGIGWDPDGATLYYVDSGGTSPALHIFDYDLDSGQIRGLLEHVEFDSSLGVPDGLVVDHLGFLWLAFWGGGLIGKVSPRGELVSTYDVPTKFPTCLAFGGEQYRDLYLTTARDTEDGLAGHLFHAVTQSVGMRQPRFQLRK
ncbi:MAG: SMP-30/gluconolactonase/LRE family protein [Ferrimicrobium sp.]